MNTDHQLKGKIKSFSQKTGIPINLVLQKFVLDRFLYQIQRSEFSESFVVKGGMVISEMTGLAMRTTMDIDLTIRNYPLENERLKGIIRKICEIPTPDHLEFKFLKIQNIRRDDIYGGIRVYLEANYQRIRVPFKLDITTGDILTPEPQKRIFSILVDDEEYAALAYNLETILAEKAETILSRGITNTRPRDFYDVYLLVCAIDQEVNYGLFKQALINTTTHRNSSEILEDLNGILNNIRDNKDLIDHWRRYQVEFEYAKKVSYEDTINALEILIESML